MHVSVRRAALIGCALAASAILVVLASTECRIEVDLSSGRIRSGYYLNDLVLTRNVSDTEFSRLLQRLHGDDSDPKWRVVITESVYSEVMDYHVNYRHGGTPSKLRVMTEMAEDAPNDVKAIVFQEIQELLARDDPDALDAYFQEFPHRLDELSATSCDGHPVPLNAGNDL